MVPLALSAADEAYPEITTFATKLKGIEWNLRGTFGLKGLQFDGKDVREIKNSGVKGGVFESAFVDVGVLRLNFSGANTGWYFFSDDLRFVTPLTVSGEVAFKLPVGPQAKAVREFPRDITNVVFESEADERQLQAAKLRWTGTHLELAKQNKDKTWLVDKLTPVTADHRVFEVEQNGLLIWFAFSQDGKEAWLLQLENIFGGQVSTSLKPAKTSSTIPGLTPQQGEILDHIERLHAAGDKVRAQALGRHLRRLVAKKPALLQQVEARLAAVK
jgi:hypothetical protein